MVQVCISRSSGKSQGHRSENTASLFVSINGIRYQLTLWI